MGRAVARAYAQAGYQVHAWNRGHVNRKKTRTMHLDNIFVHDQLEEALQHSDSLVLMMVLADEMLATAASVLQSVPTQYWQGKTLVQFTSHEPFAILAQEKLLKLPSWRTAGGTQLLQLVGGAMMAVPTTVGTPQGTFLVSATNPCLLEQHRTTLQVLGKVVTFTGDVALASLADIGFLQGLQFGLAGNELACRIFQRYGVDQSFQRTYQDLIPQTTVPIFQSLSMQACDAIFGSDYQEQAKTYTAAGHLAVYESHEYFFRKMGLLDETTYLSVYLEQFRRVDGQEGPSAIVKTYRFVDEEEPKKDKKETMGNS